MIARIKGEEAMNILSELEKGAGIYFKCIIDDDGYPVIELHKEKEKWYVDNMPCDKREQNDSRHSSSSTAIT